MNSLNRRCAEDQAYHENDHHEQSVVNQLAVVCLDYPISSLYQKGVLVCASAMQGRISGKLDEDGTPMWLTETCSRHT
jgi:hypothetical protein